MMSVTAESTSRQRIPTSEEKAFRILILGDFGADASRPLLVDRDNFERVMEQSKALVSLPTVGEIRFQELDDFHPDRLYPRLGVFQALRDARAKLEDSATFHQTAASLGATAAKPEMASLLDSGNLLDRMVGASEGRPVPAAADPFQSYLQSIVAPYLVPRPDPRQAELVAQVDAATSGYMRAVLHYPKFQAIEAAWRGLYFLSRQAETGPQLKIYILQLPKDKLAEELMAAQDLRATSLYKVLVEETVRTPGAERWAVIGGNYTFGTSNEDIELLGRIGLLAAGAGAPFLAAATPDPAAWSKETPYWEELRQIPEAPYLGLALPRFLLRLPYGKDTDSAESFEFEEMPEGPRHEDYLWGNPIFVSLCLLATSFSDQGWSMEPGRVLEIRGLPLHIYREGAESKLTPCAELLMTEDVAHALIDRGLMPLLSMKDSDRVRLAGFRGINGKRLAGPWS